MNSLKPLEVDLTLPLDRFNLEVSFQTTRQVTGVFGASGSGKTTLLEAVAGLRRTATGSITFGKKPWLHSEKGIFTNPEDRGIGYVPQDALLFPHKNVEENLRAGIARKSTFGGGKDPVLRNIIEVLELSPLLRRKIMNLSGGESQRVALGRAIGSHPQLLLLDEPLASLDLELRQKVLPFLRRVRDEFGLPMLLVSHDPVEVQALCDDLIVLREGKMIAHGNPRAVLTQPDIFPIAEQEGFENTFSATLLRHDADTSIAEIGKRGRGIEIVIPKGSGPPGAPVLLSVPAHEIIVSTSRPEGLSARNIIPGEVVTVKNVRNWRLVAVRVGKAIPDFTVEVTAHSINALGIKPNQHIFLIIKTNSFKVYP